MLPAFVLPMIPKRTQPFDSAQHLFEIKWDGIRTLAFVEAENYRLVNRRQDVLTNRYPELAGLRNPPAGTVLDGELIVLNCEGKPDFELLLARERSRAPRKIASLSRTLPVTYLVFDLLYHRGEPILNQPLAERRQRLQELLTRYPCERVVFSEGITGPGATFFAEACKQGLEGVVAKRLDSRYLPGRRTDAWLKFKRSETFPCVIIGFMPARHDDFNSLILATNVEGRLRPVGEVGTGFNRRMRERLNGLLRERRRPKPLVPCRAKAIWVDPGLYCTVTCMERTRDGALRAPVFIELVEASDVRSSRQPLALADPSKAQAMVKVQAA